MSTTEPSGEEVPPPHAVGMRPPEQEALETRRKRTIWLLAGGFVSLILPLMGVVYIRMSTSRSARGPNSSIMFDRREAGEIKINVSQTVAIVNPPASRQNVASAPDTAAAPGDKTPPRAPGSLGPSGNAGPSRTSGGSGLSLVKGNGDYFSDKTVEAPQTSTPAAATPAPAPAPAKTVAKKGGKKAFFMPKLQNVKGFSNFKGSSPRQTGGSAQSGVLDPQAAGQGGVQDMLKNLPPGSENNPEIQKLLKSQGP